MKKKILAVILAVVFAGMNLVPVRATEVTESTAAAEGVAQEETEAQIPELNPENYVDVNAIDLSLHSETSGDFSAVYKHDNPFKGTDTSNGVVIEFYVKPTWEVHVLGAIFAIVGSDDYDGRLYFTPGSYLGFNSGNYGGYFDANLFNYSIVTDYIKDGAKIRIELNSAGFAVYANDTLCYDQTILADENKGSGDYTAESDFSQVLEWLAGADTLYFGYGSWWNAVGTNEANANLSDISFRLADGTVLMNRLQADKVLIEALGGDINLSADGSANAGASVEIADVEVEIFDINSVKYEGSSIMVPMVIAVIVVAVLAAAVVIVVTKKRTYDNI